MRETESSRRFARLRDKARRIWDSFFCRAHPGIQIVGGDAAWWIRTDLLTPGCLVLSGGAGNEVSFELELVCHHGCRVWLYDPSPTAVHHMGRKTKPHQDLFFFPTALGEADGNLVLAPPRNQEEGSWRISPLRGKDPEAGAKKFPARAVGSLARENSLVPSLVKLDIEGSEYGVLREMMASGIRPPAIAVEFHHFLDGFSRWDTLRAVLLLWRHGYRIEHKRMTDYLFVRHDATPACPGPR